MFIKMQGRFSFGLNVLIEALLPIVILVFISVLIGKFNCFERFNRITLKLALVPITVSIDLSFASIKAL